ncbi:hypothetical protein J437_LFUL001353 [Ladona fulva]|uniref:Uncharacterized protein n=1 Tax=Ladona fulva TaxID=123851 RepID=A0A8K0JVA0_LADFU|nr:hypothetical protein J437_LFUL001353 [Ladona fulva]
MERIFALVIRRLRRPRPEFEYQNIKRSGSYHDGQRQGRAEAAAGGVHIPLRERCGVLRHPFRISLPRRILALHHRSHHRPRLLSSHPPLFLPMRRQVDQQVARQNQGSRPTFHRSVCHCDIDKNRTSSLGHKQNPSGTMTDKRTVCCFRVRVPCRYGRTNSSCSDTPSDITNDLLSSSTYPMEAACIANTAYAVNTGFDTSYSANPSCSLDVGDMSCSADASCSAADASCCAGDASCC